jgi:hypothetical protein
MCVALAALDAQVKVIGPNGERVIPMTHCHRPPDDTQQINTNLQSDELITESRFRRAASRSGHSTGSARPGELCLRADQRGGSIGGRERDRQECGRRELPARG